MNKPALKKDTALAAAVAIIHVAVNEADDLAEKAVRKALHVGALLIEIKPLVGHGNFQHWLSDTFGRNKYRTLSRWMELTQRVIEASGYQTRALSLPVSDIVAPDAAGLDASALEARQLFFDFTAAKTIRDCLASIVVDGQEAHAITRAHNGRTVGGFRGEDRKDWPRFINVHFGDIAQHFCSFKSFTGAQIDAITVHAKRWVAKLPTVFLQTLKNIIAEELKTR